jgi:phosphatidylglycerol:prolipoprotein diacylglycerol transferase
MHQVLFHIPLFKDSFPPDGIPVYGFGAMLFVTFIACTVWGARRARRMAGLAPERFQDLAIVLFVSGIIGARILYMIQFANQFPNQNLWALLGAFFQIWKGGIIFYGSALGGAIGYGLFYWFVLRRLNVSGWRLADAVAPLLCLGLAIGRIGCYLNGCCWGQVACEECAPVPLGAAHFPLLPAHARDQLVGEKGLQTSTGFTLGPTPRGAVDDPRSVVRAVEPGSAAAAAGLKPGDQIVKVNGQPNAVVVDVAGPPEKVRDALELFRKSGARIDENPERPPRAYFDDPSAYVQARLALGDGGVVLSVTDLLWDLARDWPRGRHELALGVRRDGQEIDLPAFAPRTVGLYPTQLYETVSMVLLIGLLLAYYPFRRHDGQLMTLCMVGYAVHRFVNESIRTEPLIEGTPLTLSQWGSVVILVAAVAIEAYLWRTMPSRWAAAPEPPASPPTAEAKP